ncbi:hypothetical protein CHUAL_004671 [Chamberlinius hualienensis]
MSVHIKGNSTVDDRSRKGIPDRANFNISNAQIPRESLPHRSRNEKVEIKNDDVDLPEERPSLVQLPPIGGNSKVDSSSLNKSSVVPVEFDESDEIALKHHISRKLESFTKETLQSVHRSLQQLDHRNIGVHSPNEIEYQFKRYHVPLSSDLLGKLLAKYVSSRFPNLVDFNRLMGYLMQIKKLPLLDVTLPNKQSVDSRLKNSHSLRNSNKRSYLSQEELPVLEELKRQLRNIPIDVATLSRYANEIDRGVQGVLSKAQVRSLLSKCGVNLTDNLLNSLLHYCDHNGYRLYNIDKLMEFFDRAVQEERSLKFNNRHPRRRSRVPSPEPPSPMPQLQRTFSAPIALPQPPKPPLPMEKLEFDDIEPQFDREEWLKRFNFMVRAIYNCHQDHPGYLTADEVEHIAKTYNLVYNLDIPNSVIDQCITQSFNNTVYMIDIRHFVQVLQSLCLQLAKFK